MVTQDRQLAALDRRGQVAHFHSRRRVLGLRDPFANLHATHNFGTSNGSITTADVFPDRTKPITFATAVEVTGIAASGVIFEFGDAVNGLKLSISGNNFQIVAGNAVSASADGFDGLITLTALARVGYRARLVYAVDPGRGEGRLFVNGKPLVRVAAATPPLLNGEWASSGGGAVGTAANGTSSQRQAAPVNGAPTDFVLVEPVRAAFNALPRQFD